jgi:hypothetical protein
MAATNGRCSRIGCGVRRPKDAELLERWQRVRSKVRLGDSFWEYTLWVCPACQSTEARFLEYLTNTEDGQTFLQLERYLEQGRPVRLADGVKRH